MIQLYQRLRVDNKGFTLSEILLSAALMGFVLVGLLSLFVGSMSLNKVNRNRSIAMAHAQFVMEDMRNKAISDIESLDWDRDTVGSQINGGSNSLPLLRNEHITAEIVGNDPKEVTVTVEWNNPNDSQGATQSLILESAFTDIVAQSSEDQAQDQEDQSQDEEDNGEEEEDQGQDEEDHGQDEEDHGHGEDQGQGADEDHGRGH